MISMSITTVERLRHYADRCRALAERTERADVARAWLRLAEQWEDMADEGLLHYGALH